MRYDLSNQYKVQCFNEYCKKLIEKKAIADLVERKKKRTIDQNALYWVWLSCIEKETGNDKNEMHLLYRANFLSKPDERITNIIIPELWERVKTKILNYRYFKGLDEIINIISESTTDQDTKGMTIYVDKVKDHANREMGIILLKLEEKGFQDFYNEYI